MNSPVVIEVDQQSVLLGWNAIQNSLGYELQMRTVSINEDDKDEEGDSEDWKTLSSSIQGTNIRKKNLVDGKIYHFRVRCKLSTGWDDYSASSPDVKVLPEDTRRIEAPTLLSRDTTSVTIQWLAPDDLANESMEIAGYRLRYRAEDSIEWTYVDTILKNNQVKKKGLNSGVNYYFSILPVVNIISMTDDGNKSKETTSDGVFNVDKASPEVKFDYSAQSAPLQVQQLSSFMANLFPKQLVAQDGTKHGTAGCLAGKMVAIYFSAHWCGPCRQFTPVLGKVYQELKAAGRTDKFEVVFCSADQSESDFQSYFHSMAPWKAIDYDDDERESFMGSFKVQGIPKLVILAPDGRMLTDNGVNPSLSAGMVEQWLKQCNL